MEVTRNNLDFVSQELNKTLDLEPPIDIDREIKDKVLVEDIKDVFENVLEKKDILSKEVENILFDMGMIRFVKEFVKEDLEEEPGGFLVEKDLLIPNKKKKPNIKKFILDSFKGGSFEGLKNKEIAEIVKERFDSKTNAATIAVYKCNYNKTNKLNKGK